jgi:hypothetical protein
MTMYPPCFASGELWYIRISLLGHDGGPGTKSIPYLKKAESWAHPENNFFRKP